MNLDIIIFSRNRENELARSLERLSKTNFRVIVFHNNNSALAIRENWRNVEYRLCTGKNFSARAREAKNFLQHPYSLICADDDGLIESQIIKMIEKLDGHKHLHSVGGVALGTFKYSDIITGNIAYSEMRRYQNLIEDEKSRIRHHMVYGGNGGIPRTGMYRLFRKTGMEKILETISLCDGISTPYVYEVATEFISAWCGGTQYLDTPYWLRNWQTEIISRKDWNRSFEFSQWWGNNSYVQENEIMVSAIKSVTGLDREFIDEVISSYTDHRIGLEKEQKESQGVIRSTARTFKQKIVKLFFPEKTPSRLGEVIKNGVPGILEKEILEIENIAGDMLNGAKRQ